MKSRGGLSGTQRQGFSAEKCDASGARTFGLGIGPVSEDLPSDMREALTRVQSRGTCHIATFVILPRSNWLNRILFKVVDFEVHIAWQPEIQKSNAGASKSPLRSIARRSSTRPGHLNSLLAMAAFLLKLLKLVRFALLAAT